MANGANNGQAGHAWEPDGHPTMGILCQRWHVMGKNQVVKGPGNVWG